MKTCIRWITFFTFLFFLHSNANANNREINGLIIGSGTGAVMGQVVGRNVESTIIGATVGGIIGAVIASDSSHHHHNKIFIHERPRGQHYRSFGNSPKYNPPRQVFNRSHHKDRKYYKNHRFHNKKHQNKCNNRNRRQYNHGNRW